MPDLATAPVHVRIRFEDQIEHIEDRLLLRIPLASGGQELALFARGTSEIKGDVLEIRLPENLVRNLSLKEGQHLWTHNQRGRFSFEWEPDR
jgi:hypothetical protein